MRGFTLDDRSIYTDREWFLARITDVCDREEVACSNFPCSWQQEYLCDGLEGLDGESTELIYGDCATGENVAYPISERAPSIGDVVLMRYRGTWFDGELGINRNVFEFYGGGLTTTLAMTALQCSGDVLSATFSEGCVSQ